jgi:hypothetical protein
MRAPPGADVLRDADRQAAEAARDSVIANAQRSPAAVAKQTTGCGRSDGAQFSRACSLISPADRKLKSWKSRRSR